MKLQTPGRSQFVENFKGLQLTQHSLEGNNSKDEKIVSFEPESDHTVNSFLSFLPFFMSLFANNFSSISLQSNIASKQIKLETCDSWQFVSNSKALLLVSYLSYLPFDKIGKIPTEALCVF